MRVPPTPIPAAAIEPASTPRPLARQAAITARVIGTPDRITMPVPQPLWFVLPMVMVLWEQPFLPDSVLPTLAATVLAVGAQRRLVRSRRVWVAHFFGRFSLLEHRRGMLLRLVDDEGRKWESRFLPVTSMAVLENDLVFGKGWVTRRGEFSLLGLTNIRTGVHRMSRWLAVWPIVLASSSTVVACTAATLL
ncbi:hypothetical protein D7D52_23510 [Nocardia yunnanensis]|uniref:Uncharacterized protein n=1 Tax=Nocardia yunnanensis TaxID=2382165 RepID=A0A386ZEJ7_9NOCA|nr:hypothetical protein [Nocardia yunnanensis]AYF76302.1 hypothetical protein D7D52_23510 [Nocardia yunnanensis]